MRGPRTGVVSLAVAALVLSSSSCATGGPGDGVATAATVPRRAPATTATTVTTPIDVVPAVIDLAYMQRVIDAIEEVEDVAVREFMAERGPTMRWDGLVRAIYEEPELEQIISTFGRKAAESDFNPEGRGPRSRVTEFIDQSPGCVTVWLERTWAAWATRTSRWEVRLRARGPSGANPTAWRIDAAQMEETNQDWGPHGPCGDAEGRYP